MSIGPLKVLLIPCGTPGDVQPFLDLALALRRRGHHPHLIASEYFASRAQAADVPLIMLGTTAEYERLLADRNLWNPAKAHRVFARKLVLPMLRPLYQTIEKHAGPNTVIAAQTMAAGARLAQEKLGVPLVSIHRQPAALRSLYHSPRTPFLFLPDLLPQFLKRLQFRLIDAVLDHVYVPTLNGLRAELGLPPLKRFAAGWLNSPQRTIGWWPDWFAPVQPDWPRQTRLVGFTTGSAIQEAAPPPELLRFLDSGRPPIVFTVGTGMRHGERFYAAAIETCRRLDRRGILVTRFGQQLPPDLPAFMHHASYAPFTWLLPRCAAIVHHAGIGTVAEALAAGIPQLCLPGLVFDTPDNAQRLVKLGVGVSVSIQHASAGRMARALGKLLDNPDTAERCAHWADHARQSRAIEDTCASIEELGEAAGQAKN